MKKTKRILPALKSGAVARWLAVLIASGIGLPSHAPASSEPEILDFDQVTDDLPGWWVAVGRGISDQFDNRRAKEWSTPVRFELASDQPHEGSVCLLWEFTDDTQEPVFVRPSHAFPGNGAMAKIAFALRAENLSGPISLTVTEHAGEERIAHHHEKAKFDATNEWEEVTWELELNPDTDNLRVNFSCEEQSQGAKIWLDNIRVFFSD